MSEEDFEDGCDVYYPDRKERYYDDYMDGEDDE